MGIKKQTKVFLHREISSVQLANNSQSWSLTRWSYPKTIFKNSDLFVMIWDLSFSFLFLGTWVYKVVGVPNIGTKGLLLTLCSGVIASMFRGSYMVLEIWYRVIARCMANILPLVQEFKCSKDFQAWTLMQSLS